MDLHIEWDMSQLIVLQIVLLIAVIMMISPLIASVIASQIAFSLRVKQMCSRSKLCGLSP